MALPKEKEKEKKKGKPGRPKGSSNRLRTAKRMVENMDNIKEKLSYDLPKMYDIMKDLIEDKTSSPVVKKGCCEFFFKLNEKLMTDMDERTPDKVLDSDDKSGEVVPFITLEYKPPEED